MPSSSSSSSSSKCCSILYCEGSHCSDFTSWTLSGMCLNNTDNCVLYASFDVLGGNQQVELYKDSLRSNLVAVGQKLVAGSITLHAVNLSGLSGTVVWNGTPALFPSFAILACTEFSSSSSSSSSTESSSSSYNSLSSSSSSESSSSSSSSHCCINYLCRGAACTNFSSWIVNGVYETDIPDCKLYVQFDYIVPQEQIRLYKTDSFEIADLVALGQDSAGIITFTQRNSSGISGSVVWNGIAVYYPDYVTIGCVFNSSSSSSSSNSSSSSSLSLSSNTSSSFSSASSSGSTSSSTSSRSSLSTSSSLSSSSSSINSFSSSSESIGNVSTSSSSSLGGWNKTKPLIWGLSAVNSSTILNRLAQTITLTDDTYSIGKAYCYLYGIYGTSSLLTLHLDLYNCNDSGQPLNLIAASTLLGVNINGDGWYAFNFNITGTSPTNRYLSFVMWQENGDENNYVLWGYTPNNEAIQVSAWISSDGLSWFQQEKVVRALRIIDNFNAYDLTNFRILTPPATQEVITQSLLGGINDGTKFVKGSYQYSPDKVVIDYPNTIISFVIDSSGSMGWNDRLGTRVEFVKDVIDKFKQKYPAEVLVDMVKFGAQVANTNSITTGLPNPMTIKIDLTSPTRTPYVFEVSSATAFKNDIYETNNCAFTVTETLNLGTTLICSGLGSSDVPPSGTLTRQSGTGDSSIAYVSYVASSISDSIVAYGFKNFENKHQYNIGEIVIGDSITQSVSLDNWQTIIPGGDIPLSIGTTTGPNGTSSLNFIASDELVLRRPISIPLLDISKISNDVLKGDIFIHTNNISIAQQGEIVDLIDNKFASLGKTVANVFSTTSIFELTDGATYNISNWDNGGGIIQQSNTDKATKILNINAELLVKDYEITRNITFFLQTINGLTIEWDFQPFEDWESYNIYWLGETAVFPISVFDINGYPFPDGTKIIFYVDHKAEGSIKEIPSQFLLVDAPVGTTQLFVSSLTGFQKDDQINVLNNRNQIQLTTITEVGTDISTGYKYVKIANATIYNFYVVDQAQITLAPTSEDLSNAASDVSEANLLPSSLSLIDVTPIYTGKSIDPLLLAPYDPTPLPPTTTYDELNLIGNEYVQSNINDIPSISGKAVIRVLPITEDNLKTLKEKEDEIARELRPDNPSSYVDQSEQNQGDLANSVSTTTTTTLSLSQGEDYEIENPVFLENGTAESSMVSHATKLVPKTFNGFNIAQVASNVSSEVLVKEYTITPSIVIEDSNQNIVAQQYLNDFSVYFTPSYSVYTNYVGTDISYVVKAPSQDEECTGFFWGYTTKTIHGVYATGNGFEMDYVVTDKGLLVQTGELRIRIYSNTLVDISLVVEEGVETSRQDLNWIPPEVQANVSGVQTVIQPVSEINAWRTVVENNPFSNVIQENANMTPTEPSIFQQMKQDIATIYSSDQHPDIEIEGATFEWYKKPEQWTKATQYTSIQDMTIPIINGKASFSVPSSDISALLMIQASIYFGDNNQYESIRSDLIAVANPIETGVVTPSSIYAVGGNTLYEIGSTIKWKGSVIDDNVVVTFTPTSTASIPAVSKTDKGWAGGIMLGPHNTLTMTCNDSCPRCNGEYETISVSVSYLGYQRTVKRIIEWTGEMPEDETEKNYDAYFYVSSPLNNSNWADGDVTKYVEFDSDLLQDIQDITWNKCVGTDGINRLMGYDQNALQPYTWVQPRPIKVKTSLFEIQYNTIWSNGKAIVKAYGFNQNIGNQPPTPANTKEDADNPPWENNIVISSNYVARDSNDTRFLRRAVGAADQPYMVLDSEGNSLWIVPYPKIYFKEPLQISLSIESYKNEFIRDGVDSPNIVAEVTWEGTPILGNSPGSYFPTVTFEAGTCSQANVQDSSTGNKVKIDNRGGSCLVISSHPDVSLSNGAVATSLSRTDIYTVGGKHTHACQVNAFGEGYTNKTIVLEGNVEDHVHMINNYLAAVAGNIPHTHQLRSVAITKLNPMVNPNVQIAINGYVFYDPTGGAIPYDESVDTPVPRSITLSNGTVVNRMMFNTLTIYSKLKNRELLLTMEVNGNPFTAIKVTETQRAINIVVSAKFSEYSIEDYPGHWIIVPEKPVSDGTRVVFEIYAYKPQDVSKTLEVKNQQLREYMNIKIKATVYAEELYGSIEKVIIVQSNLQWLPSITNLLNEPTMDDIYLSSALAKIDTIGASQIHDAVLLTAQKINDYQTENPSWKSAKKVIFLLTDGDENTSEHSINQAIANTNFIDGKCKVPIIPVRFGYAYGSDDVLLKKYALETCGTSYNLINASNTDITNLVQEIAGTGLISINSGVYTNTIDLGKENLASNISLESLLLPYGARVLFRYRLSSDDANWNSWSAWYPSSVSKDFSLDLKFKARYFQYQIYLYGNEDFESPEIYAGITLYYYKAQTFMVFFQPVDLDIDSDEYLASIHITHKATIPSTSTINYGYTQFDTVEPEDYYSVTRPMITPDRHTIILDRYNELFLTQNYQKYTAINGGWPKDAVIQIYRISSTPIGELVDPGSYAANYKDGTITFYNIQNKTDRFVLCINFDPVFRILCDVTNYGPEAILIDYIGVLYNIAKRIPTDLQGNIIHAPLNERI